MHYLKKVLTDWRKNEGNRVLSVLQEHFAQTTLKNPTTTNKTNKKNNKQKQTKEKTGVGGGGEGSATGTRNERITHKTG